MGREGGGGGLAPLKLIQLYSMYVHLLRKSKKWTFYNVKILKCEFFLIALLINSKKWTFLLLTILQFLNVGCFNRLA